MEENTNHKVDRSGWEDGPWKGEPDRKEWRYKGFPCLIVRNQMGALCGYVGVPPGHKFHGTHYMDIEDQPDVHGGLTYSNVCVGHICHIPQPGEPEQVWWLGFDCGHSDDLIPAMAAMAARHKFTTFGESYRNIDYVSREVEQLADQLED